VKQFQTANDNLIDRTRRVWQPRLEREVGREDARQIAENVTGFFAILAEWSRAEVMPAANDNDAGADARGMTRREEAPAGSDRGGARS
jgi:hypothetical protein